MFDLAADGNGGTDVTLVPSVAPTISDTVARQTTTLEAPVDPFSTVLVTDGNAGATDTLTITVFGTGGTLAGTGLTQVSAGKYTITGSADTVTTDLQGLSFTPNAGPPGSTGETVFSLGDQSSDYNGTANSPPIAVFNTDPSATVSGTLFLDANADGVQEAGDTGLAGQTVTLLNAFSQTIATTTTNAAGQYSFSNPSSAADTVVFAAPAGDLFSTAPAVAVTLSAGAMLTVNAGVYAPAAVSVLTYLDANGDGTQDNGEAGLSGVAVELETGAGAPLQSAMTNAAGVASFTGLTPGSYQVAITTPGGDTVTQQSNVGTAFTLTSGGSAQVTEGLAPPAVAPSLTASQTSLTTQSEAPLAPFASVTVSDPNAGATDTVMVSVTGQGGTLSGTGVAAVAGGYTITGSAGTITGLVEAASFTPAAGAPDTSGVTDFSLADTSSRDATTTPAVTIKLTDVDPAVAIGAMDAASSVATTDEQAASPFTGVSITDPNASQSETARVSLGAANGTLSDSLGGTVSGGVYSVTGSAGAVAADLDALLFTPTPHEAAPGTVVSTTVSAVISDTAGKQTSLATTVNATAVDDPPTISVAPPGSVTVTVPQTATPLAGVTISDPDNQTGVTETLTITETGAGAADALGRLSLATTAGVLFTEGTTGTYTLTGSLAAVDAALAAVTFTPGQVALGAGQSATVGFGLSVVQSSGALHSAAATAAGPTLTLTGATGDNSTVVNLAGYYDSVAAPATAAPYTTATGPTVNGPPYGSATIYGTGRSQTINAFGYYNTIVANGGNDTINAGQGDAAVTVSDGNGAVTVSGSQGNSSVVLGNGNDVITLGGYTNTVRLGSGNDIVNAGLGDATVTLGGGNDSVTGPQGTTSVMLGNGTDSVTLGGYGNAVTVGNGADTIVAGSGSDRVTAGAGNDTITLGGWTNTVSLGAGSDTVNAGSGDTIAINGTMLGLKGGKMEMVTVGSAGGSLTDQSSGTEVKVGPGSGSLSLAGITADKSFLLDMLGGIGGYTTYAALAKAFVSDGHGGTALPLGAGAGAAMIDFVNTPQSALTSAMFRFN